MSDFALSFSQNLLGNVFSFISIRERYSEAVSSDNKLEVTYQAGRLARRVLDFEPIEYPREEPTGTTEQKEFKFIYHCPSVPDYTNFLSTSLMSYVGFMDGAFNASNTSNCLSESIRFYRNATLL